MCVRLFFNGCEPFAPSRITSGLCLFRWANAVHVEFLANIMTNKKGGEYVKCIRAGAFMLIVAFGNHFNELSTENKH